MTISISKQSTAYIVEEKNGEEYYMEIPDMLYGYEGKNNEGRKCCYIGKLTKIRRNGNSECDIVYIDFPNGAYKAALLSEIKPYIKEFSRKEHEGMSRDDIEIMNDIMFLPGITDQRENKKSKIKFIGYYCQINEYDIVYRGDHVATLECSETHALKFILTNFKDTTRVKFVRKRNLGFKHDLFEKIKSLLQL